MSTASEPRHPSYADIAALPPHVVGEILGGELVVSPRPAPKHTCASSVLGALVTTPFHLGIGGPGGWWILDEPELSLGVDPDFDPVVPDLAGWRRDAHPSLPVTPQHHDVPQWVCEVLSPSTRRRDRILKLPFYARAGVAHVWLVDPEAEMVEVYQLDGARWTLLGTWGEDKARLAPFDAVEIDLSLLWARGPEPQDGDAAATPEEG